MLDVAGVAVAPPAEYFTAATAALDVRGGGANDNTSGEAAGGACTGTSLKIICGVEFACFGVAALSPESALAFAVTAECDECDVIDGATGARSQCDEDPLIASVRLSASPRAVDAGSDSLALALRDPPPTRESVVHDPPLD